MSFKYEYKETEIGIIPKEWDIKSLGNSLYIKGRIGWKGLKKNEYLQDGDFRIINGANIVDNKIDWERCGFITEERYNESPEIMLQQDDIVMTKDGTIGKVAIVKTLDVKTTVASGLFVIRALSEDIDIDYLYYYFNSNYFKGLVDTRVEGSVIPHLYQRDLVELKIPFPEIDEQKNISILLRTLDNKIDLNNELNKTLEEIAQALFKRWFIDFEFPNEDGEPYKTSGGEMVESELGKIPKGWMVYSVNEVCEINKSNYSNKENWDFMNYLDTANITKNKIDTIQQIDCINEKVPSRAKRKVKKDSIVYSTVRPNQLHYGIIKSPIENMIVSTGFVVLDCKLDFIKNDIIYYWLIQENRTELLQSIGETSTSTYPSIKPSDIGSMKIALPSKSNNENLAERFDKINILINELKIEEKQLIELRDSLLPKLMSGKIRIKDIEANL